MSLVRLCAAALFLAGPVLADPPRVVADIAPVHGLVAQVMDGVGTPDLIVPLRGTPHTNALRPSQARALQEAEIVFWIGPALTPWLAGPLATLAADADRVALLDVPGTHHLSYRDTGHESADDDGHAHDHGHDSHEQGNTDPHAWLDPENAAVWLEWIAQELARADPQNAALYRANAETARRALEGLQDEIAGVLAPVSDRPFVSFHDAFQYFEARFGLVRAGSVALGDATDAGPARLVRLRETIRAQDVRCAFAEPQYDPKLLHALGQGSDLTVATLDPMGSTLTPGPTLYPQLLRQMADGFADCLSR